MIEENIKKTTMKEKIIRNKPALFPMGIRSVMTENALIIDFLDPECSPEIISSIALTNDMVHSLATHLSRYLSSDE